ncbi:hypothetical protein Aperf_G00000062568 [Anoplocephala perfoliata]
MDIIRIAYSQLSLLLVFCFGLPALRWLSPYLPGRFTEIRVSQFIPSLIGQGSPHSNGDQSTNVAIILIASSIALLAAILKIPEGVSPTWDEYIQRLEITRPRYGTAKAKRHAEKSLDPLSPTNADVCPINFGALNISWDPPTIIPQSQIHHYEVLLRNLTNPEHIRRRTCSWYSAMISESGSGVATHIVPSSASSSLDRSYLQLTEMFPDTFYSIEIRTVLHNGTISQPTILPSSPLVLAAPPSGYPLQELCILLDQRSIRISKLSYQSAKVSWRLPQDIECNGELMGFTMELNSTYETNQHITITPDVTEYTLTDLMQGTDYSLRISASTRGGQGGWSPPTVFRTDGEARIIDMEAFLTTGPSTLPPLIPLQPDLPDGDIELIVDFRGQGLVKAIHLSWIIKWRSQRSASSQSFVPQNQVGWYDDSDDSTARGSENEESVMTMHDEGVPLPVAPNVMLRLIWWEGDSEPAEEMISASFSSYTLQNLRAGKPYHIRLIAIVPGENGPWAHTVATPKHRIKDSLDASPVPHHPIPVNLVVHRITPTEATLQWELPRESNKPRFKSGIVGYQVRYQATRHSNSEGDFTSILVSALPPLLVNISDPQATSVTLRHLLPETVYEFAVRAVFVFAASPEPTEYWSMIQGFETPGQRPETAPKNITVSAVMSGYPSSTLDDSVGIRDGKGGRNIDGGSASILVTWHSVPAVGPRGLYHLYLAPADEFTSARGSKSASNLVGFQRRWDEHSVSGSQNSTVVHNLLTGQPYFLLMSARNRHGRSPLSSLCFFRTADADGSGFVNLNMLSESYEMGKMTPARIQRLSEELDVLLKFLRSPETTQSSETGSNTVERPTQWILVSAILAIVVVIVIILALTILLTRRFARSRMDRIRKEYFAEANQRLSDKGEINSPMTQASQSSHHSGSPSCCDGRFVHRVGSSGLETHMHGPPTSLPPMNFDGSGGGFSPYPSVPFAVGTGSAGNPVVSGSMHNQTVLVHARGQSNSNGAPTSRGAGSESDCRSTPIDSDLESAKSANLASAYPYHHHAYQQQQQHHTMSPGRMRGSAGSPTHAGLLGSPEIRRDLGGEGNRRSFRNYHIHQPVPLPPKMEDLFASSSPSPSKSSGRPAILLPYRNLGHLETSPGVGTVGGSNESAEASRSTAGSSGYGSVAPTNATIHQLNQLAGVGEKVLTESYLARQPQPPDGQSVDSGTLPRKYISSPGTPTAESERSTSDDLHYQNHASIKLNSSNNLLPIPCISAVNEQNLTYTSSCDTLEGVAWLLVASSGHRGSGSSKNSHFLTLVHPPSPHFLLVPSAVLVEEISCSMESVIWNTIVDFRGQGLVKAIHLSWIIKWRSQRSASSQSFVPQNQVGWYDDSDDSTGRGSENEESVMTMRDEGVPLPVAPNVMLRLIWWEGDSEPAEEMISASFSSYTLQNLRAGKPYHIRLIAIVPGENGPWAHTVATPKHRIKDSLDASPVPHHPIPVNLVVHRITPTEATLQWELPRESNKPRFKSGIVGYQVRYQATRHSNSEGDFTSILVSALPPLLVNISDPEATSVTLRHLLPETVYEFAVRAVFVFAASPEPTEYWSMIQGFETPGQRPETAPKNITVSAVMSGYPSSTLDDSVGIRDGKGGRNIDGGSASILVTWHSVPAVGPRGLYHLYLAPADEFTSARGSKSASNLVGFQRRWDEHSVSGSQNSTVVHNLLTGQPYFLLMSARNRHGRSPLSSLCFFRTADAKDCLGLDMTCGDYIAKPCCPGLFCRKVRDGVKYGICSICWSEIEKLMNTTTTTTAIAATPVPGL